MSFIVRNPNATPFILSDAHLYYEFAPLETGVDLEEVFSWENLYRSSMGTGALLNAITSSALVRRNSTNTSDIAIANAFNDAIWRWHLTEQEKSAIAGSDSPSAANPFVTSDDDRLFTQNTLYVKQNPGEGEFSSVQAAIDSITTNSVSNPWKIMVGPGVYTSANSIVLKPYIWLQGSGDFETIYNISDPSKPVVIGADFSAITHCLVQGALNSGIPGIFYGSSTGNDNTYFYVENLRLGHNDTLVIADGANGITTVYCNNLKFGSIYQFNQGFVARNGGRINIRDSTSTGMTAPMNGDVFLATGLNSALVMSFVQIGAQFLAGGNGIRVNDGARLRIVSVTVRNFARGLFVENAGTAPNLFVGSLGLEGCTQDLVIDHPGATGSFFGSADANKVTVNPASDVSVAHINTDLTKPGVVFIGGFFAGNEYAKRIDLNKLTVQGGTLGLFSGGVITDAGGLNVNISNGEGFVRDGSGQVRQYTWTNNSLSIPADSSRYIIINNLGTLAIAPNISNLIDIIVLGRVVTNTSDIDFIEKSYFEIQHFGDKVEVNLRRVLGPVFGSGSTVTQNGARLLDVTPGQFAYGTRIYNPSGGTAISFTAHYRDGTGGWVRVPGQTVVDNEFYDNGTGTLVSIPTNDYVKHVLYLVGDGVDEKYMMVYAQAVHNALAAAETGPLPNPPPWFTDAVTPIASMIVRKSGANLDEVRDERPRIGFAPSGVSATADHGSLLGLADDDHPQYLLVNGTRAMSGALDMGSNNIINAGTIDGINVGAHGARHNPNGLDPLATAAPTVNLTATTTNSAGIANSYSRADHSHAISTGAPASQNTDQVNSAGTSANLARADHIHNIPTAIAVSIDANSINTQGSSTSFARADHTHASPTGLAVSLIPDQLNAIGTSASFSRADHVHNVPTAAPITALSATTANTQGVAANFSRSDHSHAILTGAPISLTPEAGNSIGASSSLARADHIHNIPTDVAIPLIPDGGNSEGTANFFARADHVHNVPTAAAVSLSANSTNSQGSASAFARADHTHAISTAAAVTLNPDSVNAVGTSLSFSRADHVHNIPTALAVALTPDAPNAQGISLSFARADHVHHITTALPVAIGASNELGSAASFSRADHLHEGVHGIRANFENYNFGDVTLQQGLGVNISDSGGGIITISAAQIIYFTTFHVTYPGSGLSVNYTGGNVRVNDVLVAVPNGSLTLPPSESGAIYVNPAGIVVATTGNASTPANYIPFAGYATDATSVTNISDRRVWVAQNLVWGIASDITTIQPDDIANAGVSDKYARADHRHAATATAPTTSLSAVTANAEGVANSFARGDHTHAILTGVAATQTPDQINAAGTSANLSRSDHVHNIPTAAAIGLSATTTNTQGTALNFARSDHTHAIATGPASSQSPDQANATGTSVNLSRADHVHNIPTAAAIGLSATTTNTQGSALTFARSDHTHAIATGVVSTQIPDQANSAGTSLSLARSDHIHNIPADTAITINATTVNAEGVSTSFARADHTHAIPSAIASTMSTNANTLGSSVSFARADHTHQLTFGTALLDHVPQYDGTNWLATYPELLHEYSRSTMMKEDWIAGVTGSNAWLNVINGGGGLIALSTTLTNQNHPGVIAITGGNAAGRYSISTMLGTTVLGGSVIVVTVLFQISTTATANYRIGLGDGATNVDNNNGVYLEFNSSTSPNWLIKTANGGTRTSNTTTTAALINSWQKLVITIDAAATTVNFNLNGTSLGNITTNIPTVNVIGPQLLANSLGGVLTVLSVDYFTLTQRFTSAR